MRPLSVLFLCLSLLCACKNGVSDTDAAGETESTSGASTGGASTGGASTGGATTGGDGLVIEIEGAPNLAFVSNCPEIDFGCGAQAVCEALTKGPCLSQAWDCVTGDGGLSFYSEKDGLKGPNFGAYPVSLPSGNICACDPAWFDQLGIPRVYMACNEGAWRFKP